MCLNLIYVTYHLNSDSKSIHIDGPSSILKSARNLRQGQKSKLRTVYGQRELILRLGLPRQQTGIDGSQLTKTRRCQGRYVLI